MGGPKLGVCLVFRYSKEANVNMGSSRRWSQRGSGVGV